MTAILGFKLLALENLGWTKWAMKFKDFQGACEPCDTPVPAKPKPFSGKWIVCEPFFGSQNAVKEHAYEIILHSYLVFR